MKDALKLIGLTALFLVTIGASVTFFIMLIDLRIEKSSDTESTIVENTDDIEHSAAPAFFNQSPEEGLVEALDYYEIQFPEIVYAQALLETGHFSSSVCKNYNNLFGLYNSYKRDYLPLFRDTLHYKYTAQWRLRRCAYKPTFAPQKVTQIIGYNEEFYFYTITSYSRNYNPIGTGYPSNKAYRAKELAPQHTSKP